MLLKIYLYYYYGFYLYKISGFSYLDIIFKILESDKSTYLYTIENKKLLKLPNDYIDTLNEIFYTE